MPLLYDGDCVFCTEAVAWMQRRFEPAAETVAVKSGELEAVQWVDGDVRLSGADAIAAWLRTSRRLRPLVRLIPLGLPLGRLLYPVVARNRSRISRIVRWRCAAASISAGRRSRRSSSTTRTRSSDRRDG